MPVHMPMPRLIPIKDFSDPMTVGIQATNNRLTRWMQKMLSEPSVNNLIDNGNFTTWSVFYGGPVQWMNMGTAATKTNISSNPNGIQGYGLGMVHANGPFVHNVPCHVPCTLQVSGWVLGDVGYVTIEYTIAGTTNSKQFTIKGDATTWKFFPGTSTGYCTVSIPAGASYVTVKLSVPPTSTGMTWAEIFVSEGNVARTWVKAPEDIDHVTGDFSCVNLHVTGKATVDGPIDPTYLALTQQSSTPSGIPDSGLFALASNSRLYRYDSASGLPKKLWEEGDVGTSPGGSNMSIQFNDSGIFGGGNVLTWDKILKILYTEGFTATKTIAGSVVGYVIRQQRNAEGLYIYKDATGAGDCIKIVNYGSGYDIYGMSGTWKITKTGNIITSGTVDGVDVSAHAAGTAISQHTAGLGNHTHQSSGYEGGQLDHGSSMTASSLLDDDHTIYLKADGTRQLVGNLGVASTATVDGVDISTHASGYAKIRHASGVGDHNHQTSGAEGGQLDHGSSMTVASLADDDHTIYLKADGTRQLTGNLGVASTATVDGVDISAIRFSLPMSASLLTNYNTTKYLNFTGGYPAEVDAELPAPPMTVEYMAVNVYQNTISTDTIFTLRKNGSSSGVVITVTASTTGQFDVDASCAFDFKDSYDVMVVTTGSSGGIFITGLVAIARPS